MLDNWLILSIRSMDSNLSRYRLLVIVWIYLLLAILILMASIIQRLGWQSIRNNNKNNNNDYFNW
jgi:hypothetical protein